METKTFNTYKGEKLTYSHVIEFPPLISHSSHTHNVCEIHCVYAGNGSYITEGSRHKFHFGKLFLMRAGESHMPVLTDSESYERLTIHFDTSLVDLIDKDGFLLKPFFDRPLGANNVYSRQTLVSSDIYEIFAKMDKIDTSKPDADVKFKVHFFALLEEISTLFGSKLYDKIYEHNSETKKIIEYINSHITEDMTVNDICEKFYISRSQLNRNFNSLTGSSVWEYVTNKRLVLVKQYIDSGISIVNAAQAAGFGDYSSFYRAYKKKYGSCPSNKPNKA